MLMDIDVRLGYDKLSRAGVMLDSGCFLAHGVYVGRLAALDECAEVEGAVVMPADRRADEESGRWAVLVES